MEFSSDEEAVVREMLASEWVGPEELAYLMSVSSETAREWCASGLVSALRVGSTWRVPNADLVHFIKFNQELFGVDE